MQPAASQRHWHGISVIRDTIFPQRFMHCAELKWMGADIKLDNGTAVVRGVAQLSAAPVMASDLRRYEHIDEKLFTLGANAERV